MKDFEQIKKILKNIKIEEIDGEFVKELEKLQIYISDILRVFKVIKNDNRMVQMK